MGAVPDPDARLFLIASARRLNLLAEGEAAAALERAGEGGGGPIQWSIREGVLPRAVLRAILGAGFLRGAVLAGLVDEAAATRLAALGEAEAEHLEETRATKVVAKASSAEATRVERATSVARDAPPAWVAGYRIVRKIGQGGMANVYLAERDGHSYAVKILLPEVAERPEYLRRFEREGNVAGRLRHPNIVQVVRAGIERGLAYLVMEFVRGPTLAESVRERLPLSPTEAVVTVAPIAAALAHAHSRGILHRDVKAENVLVGATGLRLADFGLVKEIGRVVGDRGDVWVTEAQILRIEGLFRSHMLEVLEKPHVPVQLGRRLDALRMAIRTAQDAPRIDFSLDSLSRLARVDDRGDPTRSLGVTATGECLGTPLYMSPEQFAGTVTDGRTDVFSLGVLFYRLLTGEYPWRGASLREIGRAKLSVDAAPPAGVPDGHAAVALKMIARHPEARYPTVAFAHRDLLRLAAGQAPLLTAPSWWEEAVAERAAVHVVGEDRTGSYEFLTGLWLEFLSMARFVDESREEEEEPLGPGI